VAIMASSNPFGVLANSQPAGDIQVQLVGDFAEDANEVEVCHCLIIPGWR